MNVQAIEELSQEIPETAAEESAPSKPRRNRARNALALSVFLAVAAASAWAYLFFVTRPADDAIDQASQQAAVDSAASAATAILSYKSDTVDADLDAANSLVTGTFGDYYRTFTRDVVSPAAKEKKISTSATVVGKAISDFSEDKAVVLVFVNQSTTTAEVTQPTTTTTTIRIEVERHSSKWLVSKFDPA
ncbi:twin-arginine translocation pathway signal [Antrihabitans stalactiti]|uniref:Twin-arginine translocation pathway signal n=1 Tax=Antrihabitans stalactiti TaxID=2584121 RepID=A0A848K3V9_9NOCA|nr:twin-arginine translocation pathway signal [Antrihabitans stalactiti]NMN93825.1 twin-arginine translocation pathway signal [Antrihabitans stalactiti]